MFRPWVVIRDLSAGMTTPQGFEGARDGELGLAPAEICWLEEHCHARAHMTHLPAAKVGTVGHPTW